MQPPEEEQRQATLSPNDPRQLTLQQPPQQSGQLTLQC